MALRCTKQCYHVSCADFDAQQKYNQHASICKLCECVPHEQAYKKYDVSLPCGDFFKSMTKITCIKHLKGCDICMDGYKQLQPNMFPQSLYKVMHALLKQTKEQVKFATSDLENFYKKYKNPSYKKELTFENARNPDDEYGYETSNLDTLKNYCTNLRNMAVSVEQNLPICEKLEKQVQDAKNMHKASLQFASCESFMYCRSMMSLSGPCYTRDSMQDLSDALVSRTSQECTFFYSFSKETRYAVELLTNQPQIEFQFKCQGGTMDASDGLANPGVCVIRWKLTGCLSVVGGQEKVTRPWMAFITSGNFCNVCD